jgi:uncharacterized protein YheU (UPF0270 family)
MRHVAHQFERNNFPRLDTIAFSNGRVASVVTLRGDADAGHVLRLFSLPQPRALLIINGATGGLATKVRNRLNNLFDELAQLIVREGIDVITGGTKAGIFEIFGEALKRHQGPTAPCIGVLPAKHADLNTLEPHHSHFVLVEEADWGGETTLMYRLADALASESRSLALFAGGGPVTIDEMQHNVAQRRELILIGGTQGSTDELLRVGEDDSSSNDRISEIKHNGRITLFDEKQKPRELISLVRSRLLDI